jgi:hypothetical protein
MRRVAPALALSARALALVLALDADADAREARAGPNPPEPPARGPIGFEGAASAVASMGVAPTPVVGAALGVGVRVHAWSLMLEGRVDLPTSAPVEGGGRVGSFLAVGALVPCVTAGPFVTCVLFQAGALRGSNESVVEPRSTALLWLAAGVRAGVQFPIQPQTLLRVRTDFVVDLDPPRLQFDGAGGWTAPRIASSLGCDFVTHF